MAFDAWGASWGGAFTRFVRWGAFESATVPTFGPPFIDKQAMTASTIGLTSLIRDNLGINASMPDTVEKYVGMASPRISRSVRNE